MLEVNNFNAIRISLTSPDQIERWSHGEVTKPETINYRTLKPERDGLFCERIFGPTKDWECYCGKYKRVRYKGIICDKCGVEVTRAKVRRERMGHIKLAAPVSHIWYVKGTPSRLGLLLDISPRNLERVLYFATYIVTQVDTERRDYALDQLRQEAEGRVAELVSRTENKLAELTQNFTSEAERLEEANRKVRSDYDEDLSSSQKQVRDELKTIDARLKKLVGKPSDEDILVPGSSEILVSGGETVAAEHRERIKELVAEYLENLSMEARRQQENSTLLTDAERDQKRYAAEQEASDVQARSNTEATNIRKTTEELISELEDIAPLDLMTEQKVRELQDKMPGVFRAGMGAEAVREIVARIDLNDLASELRIEIQSASGQRRKKATKRLRVVEAFRKSGNRPEWMFFTSLPVIPPDLRPMVQLDGGRFATSDLNDLYRRVINRNNRLRKLLELSAPEIIIRNEKRMLQEAVDALIDNGRRGRVVSGSGKHRLKSLSDMLKGKQGRFRQNLLGKRVDYSGRSVIVVGPDLKLHQCGLPKKMALELFKPFVMRRLVQQGLAHNIKSAKRIVERVRPEVWDVLEEVIKDYLVLLNRAPSLHRLSIQAFEAVLIEGSAIQLHPMVCSAFNADFDGDQMAVHVPLSAAAQKEARELMLSVHNILSPAHGEPMVSPSQDIVLGCYYMTVMRTDGRTKGHGKVFSSPDEAVLAYNSGVVDLQAPIMVRMAVDGAQRSLVETTAGRLMFNEVVQRYNDQVAPELQIAFRNVALDKGALRAVIGECHKKLGHTRTAEIADNMKRLGFTFATKSGMSVAVADVEIPAAKDQMLADADHEVDEIEHEYRRGLLTDNERYQQVIEVWNRTTDAMTDELKKILDPYGLVNTLASSGATKARYKQIRQLAAMRGLMADPSGRIIELPIRSNFREGLTVLEYFVSTHGGRKGLADTALRTADAGYLTRRLVDVAQDVLIAMEDCGTTSVSWIHEPPNSDVAENFAARVVGRFAAQPIADPKTGEVFVDANEEVTETIMERIVAAGIKSVPMRAPLTCDAVHGICQRCYGRSLATGDIIKIGEAVGIIAAQSIGEPGTQLTLRTFHTGGVASTEDITQGLPRVEELFEARVPKGQAILAEIDGRVELTREDEIRHIRVVSSEVFNDPYALPTHYELLVKPEQDVAENTPLFHSTVAGEEDKVTVAHMAGKVILDEENQQVIIRSEETDSREYTVLAGSRINVAEGDYVVAGTPLTEGSQNPQEILAIMGREAVQRYLVDQVQTVYRLQGVNVNDKHIETIVRQMLLKVRIDLPGDTDLLPGELIDHYKFDETNFRVLAEGGEPATATPVLLGITKASLSTDSFLSAASFQETTRVLTEAAINGQVDRLRGLKENVIIGKLIPAGSGAIHRAQLGDLSIINEGTNIDEYLRIAQTDGDGDPGEVISMEAAGSDPELAFAEMLGTEVLVGADRDTDDPSEVEGVLLNGGVDTTE
ncbi:MAG TPA: DNA-directed RNA polymerase subunit beta' [Chloroflexia bacterium]|nr:DNA-directed RNA polymerase subunit beta' [Chloroflexia bacterium]